jgi:5-methylcytosine-specific restriction endonuclease McrA
MHAYTLTHLSDAALLRDLAALITRDRITTAELLAHIAEVDARRLYLPAGYSSMYAYCVDELRLSEDAAYKRIQAARAARQFPAVFTAVAEGRLHLAAVCLLAPHLTLENAEGLLAAAAHRHKSEIEELLGQRFGVTTTVRATSAHQLAPGQVGCTTGPVEEQHAPAHVERSSTGSALDDQHAPGQVEESRIQPAESSVLLQLAIHKSTHDKLRYAQTLLSHSVRSDDVAQVVDRALDALIAKLERQKIGADTKRPPRERTRAGGRYVPSHVRRAVWNRDGGQCTFVSEAGHRCTARRLLEFDHVVPVAHGGQATVDGMRVRCRAHNQFEAERAFGATFMNRKRDEARRARADARAQAAAKERAVKERASEVLAGLRGLGCRADEARRAAEYSETLHGAPLEERMRAALQFLSRASRPARSI